MFKGFPDINKQRTTISTDKWAKISTASSQKENAKCLASLRMIEMQTKTVSHCVFTLIQES